jgi:hypothetical protein
MVILLAKMKKVKNAKNLKEKFEDKKYINFNLKSIIKNSLKFQVKFFLHEIKLLIHFGFAIILRYFNKVYFHFTLHLRAWAHT